MNKQELIARIVKETRVSKALASRMVAATLGSITKSLKKGDAVTLVGFGTFKTAVRKARKGRNPLTGGAIKIPRRKPCASAPARPSRPRSTKPMAHSGCSARSSPRLLTAASSAFAQFERQGFGGSRARSAHADRHVLRRRLQLLPRHLHAAAAATAAATAGPRTIRTPTSTSRSACRS